MSPADRIVAGHAAAILANWRSRLPSVRRTALITLLLASFTVPAVARPYMWIPAVTGSVQREGFEGWIEVASFTLIVTAQGCRGVRVVKQVDSTSPALLAAVGRGQRFAEVRFDAGADAPGDEQTRIVLMDAVIRSVQLTTAASGTTQETWQIDAEWAQVALQPKGSPAVQLRDKVETRLKCTSTRL